MKLTFVANFLNQHTLPICKEFYNILGDDFIFIATAPMSKERIDLKNTDLNKIYPFVITTYDKKENLRLAYEIVAKSDVVILGSAPDKMLFERLRKGKLTFKHCERLFKQGTAARYYIKNALRVYKHFGRFRKTNLYCLAASAYTAADINSFLEFNNRVYKWGYFTEYQKCNDIKKLIQTKTANSLLWVGRLVDGKYPEEAIETARFLKLKRIPFNMEIIGIGEKKEILYKMIKEYNLEDSVHMLGSMSPEQVQKHMKRSQIFLFTSDFREGWGAVLNEAMSNACAVVTSHASGAVPYLIKNNYNGLIYRNGEKESLYKKVVWLLENTEKREEIAQNAYETIDKVWNAQNAARKFILLSEKLMAGEKAIFDNGPCSKAEIITNDWYQDVDLS